MQRLQALRASISTGKQSLSGEQILTDLREYRGFPSATPDLPFGLQHLRTIDRQ
jgi:hypothetical protein